MNSFMKLVLFKENVLQCAFYSIQLYNVYIYRSSPLIRGFMGLGFS